ncbi:MAG: helix-turn-helix domain-containing protein [Clostridia bacterium]|nr:helix-turn-helix domain-containing protein [Clostridia bacterium]
MESLGNNMIGTKEAAAILGISPSTVQRYCRQGKFGQDAMQDAPEHPWHIRREAVLQMKERKNRR